MAAVEQSDLFYVCVCVCVRGCAFQMVNQDKKKWMSCFLKPKKVGMSRNGHDTLRECLNAFL